MKCAEVEESLEELFWDVWVCGAVHLVVYGLIVPVAAWQATDDYNRGFLCPITLPFGSSQVVVSQLPL